MLILLKVITIAHIANLFWQELEENTSPCGNHLKHGETLLKCKMIDEKTLRVAKMISFNPFEANMTAKFICDLADKYCITIEGIAQPTMVGPSVTKNDTFYVGTNIDRLLKWYQKYGFEIQEINSKHHIKRSPK